MHSLYRFISLVTCIFFAIPVHGAHTYSWQPIDADKQQLTIHVDDPHNDFVYYDSIELSADHPAVTLSDWQANTSPIAYYDPTFKETKKIINKPFTITLDAHTTDTSLSNAHIHHLYYQYSNKKVAQQVIPLTYASAPPTAQLEQPAPPNLQEQSEQTNTCPAPTKTEPVSWSAAISTLVETTDSLWLRIALVMLLGLLLSLTPCIYPMIPITIGILQAQGSTSLVRNFFISLAYTTGIATTFALMGLLAAFTGQMFGSIMANPVFIVTIVALLIYLALSMIGLYDMYTPRFMQTGNNNIKGGSIISVFLFGAASGTVASPCLSPGLILLLTLVTTLGSKILGFVLLFAFGMGLGIPLLIIGTFSGSLNMIPRAGMWMVEIKRFFGFLMLGMCLYFLKNIAPWWLILIIATALSIGIGLFYLYHAMQKQTGFGKLITNALGMALISASVLTGFYAFKALSTHAESHTSSVWQSVSFDCALTQAKERNTFVLLDISAPYCSICKAIDAQLFTNPLVVDYLQRVVPVQIDGSAQENKTIVDTYEVIGVPTFLLIDPNTKKAVARWGSELYDKDPQTYILELEKIIDPDQKK